MSSRSASFFATYTTSIIESSETKTDEATYIVTVGKIPDHTGVYSWDFDDIDDDFNSIVTEIASATITKIELSFKYNNNVDTIRLIGHKYAGGTPEAETAATILAGISSTELASIDIISSNKTGITVTLDDEDNFYYETQLKIGDRSAVSLTLERDSDLSSAASALEISGETLFSGGSEWRAAAAGEPVDAPLLIITYDIEEESHPTLNMKYTTSDPTTSQSTPANSIGLYVAINDVYSSGAIRESINSTQKTIPIETTSSLPTVIGLGSVGPEVFRYSAIDSTNHQLSTVARGISPKTPFPAGFDSFKNAERVYYLDDLTKLFDTRPSSGLVQYRCLAVINSDTGNDFNIQDASIGIAQDFDSEVQIRIGVEVSRFDTL